MEVKYQRIKRIAEKELRGSDAGHDINHAERVYDLCLKLAKGEKGVDLEILKKLPGYVSREEFTKKGREWCDSLPDDASMSHPFKLGGRSSGLP